MISLKEYGLQGCAHKDKWLQVLFICSLESNSNMDMLLFIQHDRPIHKDEEMVILRAVKFLTI